MSEHADSLVTRFYGVHAVKAPRLGAGGGGPGGGAGRTVRFIVMSNLFNTDVQIHRRYDLKVGWGS
eukprot:149493-Chlamydomonas_euryale.AAC.1